jgi:hypothetical protein
VWAQRAPPSEKKQKKKAKNDLSYTEGALRERDACRFLLNL